MNVWGPQASGGPARPHVYWTKPRGGGWMWLFFITWVFLLFLGFIGFIAAVSPPMDVECPNELFGSEPPSGSCPEKDAALEKQHEAYNSSVLSVLWATAIISVLTGFMQGFKQTRFMYGRTGLLVMTLLFAAIPFAAYALGYVLGIIIPSLRKRKQPVKKEKEVEPFKTEAQRLLESPNILAAIAANVEAKTGKLPGAVVGWSLDGCDALMTATPRGGTLVIGPPGSGKTSSVLIPTVFIAPGACVSSSIKSDVMNASWHVRAQRGRVWHFDPGGDEITPDGVEQAHWSPLASIRSWDDALQVGKAMGDTQGANGTTDYFVGRATDWMQTLLYAAHLDGKSISTVAKWVTSATELDTSKCVLGILADAADSGDEGADIAWQKLKGLLSIPERELGSIASTMARMMSVYDSVAARRLGENLNFDPRAFVRSTDTLYITARPDKQDLYAPLLAALLEQIRFETYDRTKREQANLEPEHPHVTFVLDEANTTAPIPLPAIISEAGGQGLHLVVGLQSIGPAISRWGEAAKSFLTLFPTKVVFRGVFDHETVSALSEASGEYDRQMTSYSVSTSYLGPYNVPHQTVNPTYQTQRQRVLTPGDITGIPEGRALLWEGPSWGLVGIGLHWISGVWITVSEQAKHAILRRQHSASEVREITEGSIS